MRKIGFVFCIVAAAAIHPYCSAWHLVVSAQAAQPAQGQPGGLIDSLPPDLNAPPGKTGPAAPQGTAALDWPGFLTGQWAGEFIRDKTNPSSNLRVTLFIQGDEFKTEVRLNGDPTVFIVVGHYKTAPVPDDDTKFHVDQTVVNWSPKKVCPQFGPRAGTCVTMPQPQNSGGICEKIDDNTFVSSDGIVLRRQ